MLPEAGLETAAYAPAALQSAAPVATVGRQCRRLTLSSSPLPNRPEAKVNMSSMLHYRHPYSDRQLPVIAVSLVTDPLAAGREFNFCEAQQRYAVGTAQSAAVDVTIEYFPWVELMLIEAGQVCLEGDGFKITAGAGDALLIPRGQALRWHHSGDLRRLYMVFPGAASEGKMPGTPIKFDLAMNLQPDEGPAPNVLLTEAPVAAGVTLFTSGDGALRIGIWESSPYARDTIDPGYCELMHVLDGKINLTPPVGAVCEVLPGETVVVPAGVRNSWVNDIPVRKLWCKLT